MSKTNNLAQAPIFIAGPDRSGTSLIFALLCSHPNISMVRRTNMWRYFHGRYGDLSQPENSRRCLIDMVRYNRMRHLNPDPERIWQEFRQGEPTYGRLFTLFHQHHAERTGKPRWGDKSLHTEHYIDRVIHEYPHARCIHMTRDPRDRYASVRKRHGNDIPRLGASTARWLLSMMVAQRNRKKYPNNYMILRFEDLAENPEETMRRVCAFIGEDFTPETLDMQGAADFRDKGGNSSFKQLNPGEISTQPIGRFREVLAKTEVVFIQMFAGPLMKSFGYQPEEARLSPGEQFLFLLRVFPFQLARMAGWVLLTKISIWRGIKIPPSRLANNIAINLETQDSLF
jgi:hypothetical protein